VVELVKQRFFRALIGCRVDDAPTRLNNPPVASNCSPWGRNGD